MPGVKISQLDPGGTLQPTDEFPIARGSTTRKIVGSEFLNRFSALDTKINQVSADAMIIDNFELSAMPAYSVKSNPTASVAKPVDVTASQIDTVFLRPSSGNIQFGKVTPSMITGNLSATQLVTTRTLWGQPFNGTQNVSGDISGAGNITAAGNVGIGTNNPQARLHINGPGVDDSQAELYITNSSKFLSIHNSLGSGQWNGITQAGDTGIIFSDGAINTGNFIIAPHATGSGGIRITSSGNVGIGISSPSYRLHVSGDIYANGGWLRVSGNNGLFFESHGGGWLMSDSTWIRTVGNKNVYQNQGILRTDGTFQVGDNGGTLSVAHNGNFAYRGSVLFANTAGNVGIGTTNPTQKLDVFGNILASGSGNITAGGSLAVYNSGFFKNDGAGNYKVQIGEALTSPFHGAISFQNVADGSNQPRAYISAFSWNDSVYSTERRHGLFLGSTSTSSAVRVNILNATSITSNNVFYNSLVSVSDKKFKTNIKTIQNGLEKIKSIRGVSYTDTITNKQSIGFIAQEIQNILPEIVAIAPDGSLGINYTVVVSVLVEAIKELNEKIDNILNTVDK